MTNRGRGGIPLPVSKKRQRNVMDEIRRVVLICGPPGSGKSTLAASLGLQVFDLDDWPGTPKSFRAAIARLRHTPNARAAVIRTDPFSDAAELCGATEQIVLDVPLRECIKRIRTRGRTTPPIRSQIAAATDWWRDYEHRGRAVPRIGVPRRRSL